MVFIIIMGIASYLTIQRQMFPNIEINYITVNATYPGASPQEIEVRDVVGSVMMNRAQTECSIRAPSELPQLESCRVCSGVLRSLPQLVLGLVELGHRLEALQRRRPEVRTAQ